MPVDPQAAELNEILRRANPHVFSLLSERGRSIYFPKKGILSQTAEAAGKPINATIGTALEDDGNPVCLESIFRQLTNENRKVFAYAPSPGKPENRAAWKEMLVRKNPALKGANISQPVVTCALTHGLSMAGYLFVGPEDTIILPDLYWENYDLVFGITYGGRLESFPMFDGNGFNLDGLRARLLGDRPGKRIVLLNFPNNPTGYTATTEEAKQIRQILVEAAEAGNDVLALIDDAYFGLVFEDGIYEESLFGLLANAHERILAVKFDGPTKEDYVWGFRIGFVTFGTGMHSPQLYSGLEAKLAGAIRGTISNASNIAQTMLMNAYRDPAYEEQKAGKFGVLKKRYDEIRSILDSHPEYAEVFSPLPFNSGYFMCVKIHSGKAEAVRQVLLDKYETGVIASGVVIRIAFSSTPFSRLRQLFQNVFLAAKEVEGNSAL